MAVTQNTYTGNGSTTNYSFTFPYLEEDEIKVSLNGTLTTAYNLANATTISFTTAPANGAAIRIYRQTDTTATKSTFFPGSAIRAQDLNENFLQTLYVSQESDNTAASATATANTALTNSATAVSTANTANTNASAAVSTANTASANASAAVSTANTASSNATTAVNTANTASANATTAINTANAATTTANNAVTTANGAVSTANTALTNANAAVSTANTASTNASSAVSTANTASSNATSAVNTANTATTTANNAVTTANSAVTTANSAVTTANAAAAAVANAVLYTTVANVAAIPGSPSNNTAIEVTNSTGIESFTPLSGLPGGFVGSSGLSVRIIYQTVGATWTWIQYFPNDPESRYFKLSGGTITGAITVPQGTVSSPGVKFSGTGNDNTGVYSPGIDELGLVTNGVNRLSIDSAGAVSIPGTLGVTGAVTGTSTVSGSALIPTGSSVPTNGVYLPAANSVAISTGGSGRLFIDSSGRVKVGDSSSVGILNIRAVTNGNLHFRDIATVVGSGTGVALDVLNDASNTVQDLALRGATTIFRNASSETMRITSAGLVGIGTSSPSQLMHIYQPQTNTVAYQLIENNRSRNAATQYKTTLGTWLVGNGIGADVNRFTIYEDGVGDRLVVDTSGRVGIGTTSPDCNLHVQGTTDGIYARLKNTAGTSSRIAFESTGVASASIGIPSGSSALAFYLASESTERMRIDSSGRLLVGTSTTVEDSGFGIGKLQVSNPFSFNNVLFSAHSNTGINGSALTLARSRGTLASPDYLAVGDLIGRTQFSVWGGTNYRPSAVIAAEADLAHGSGNLPSRLVFSTTADGASSPTERMRIGQNGSVMFGKTDVNQSAGMGAFFTTGNSTQLGLVLDTATTSFTPLTIYNLNATNNGFRFYVKQDGGIGNFQANNVNLSDINTKKDISPAADTWNCIKEWEIVNYRYKDQPDDADLNFGVIAQQVAESCPEVITVFQEAKEATEDQPAQEERLGVKEQQMYWMAIKALQEAQVRIEALEAEVAALKAQ